MINSRESGRGVKRLSKWCSITWAKGLGSSMIGRGTQGLGLTSAVSHST